MTTLHDIARKANVSYMTVARVLSGQNKENRPSSVARAARIRRVAQEMGYRPNAAARAVTLGRFDNVVLVQNRADMASLRPTALCWSIEDALAARRCRLTLHHLPENPPSEDALVAGLLSEAFADGILLDGTHRTAAQFLTLIQKHRMPAICLNMQRPHDAVRPDDFQGGMLATEHLLAEGHRRIAYLDVWNHPTAIENGTAHYSARDRHAGYVEAMKKAGLAPQSILTKKTLEPLPVGDLPVEEILAADGPTALISYGPEGLVRLHTLAETRSRRIQLVTFGETPRTLCGEIPVDTVLIPSERLAEVAVDLLFQKISRPDQLLPAVSVPYVSIASLPSAPPYDGLRAAARSLSICVVPTRQEAGPAMNQNGGTPRNAGAKPARNSLTADPGPYSPPNFSPMIRRDSTPAAAPSLVPPAEARSAREPAGRP